MSECQVCTGKTDDAFLCRGCLLEITRAVGDMPALLAELEITATRQDRIAAGGKRGKGSETPLPFNWSPSDQIWAANNTMTTWARHLAESRGTTVTTEPSAWLLKYAETIRFDEAAQQIHDEITYVHIVITQIIDRPDPEIYAGKCDAADLRVDVDGQAITPRVATCGTDLYARLGDKSVKCPTCGIEYNLADRKRMLLERVDDEWARPHVIANALTSLDEPVTPDALRKWIQRGYIVQVGIDDDRKPLYRVGDVRQRVQAMREAAMERSRRVA